MKTKRITLAGNYRYNKAIDMEWVYAQLDSGRTVKSVAQDLKVSESTLRRRHKEYQKEVRKEEKNDDN